MYIVCAVHGRTVQQLYPVNIVLQLCAPPTELSGHQDLEPLELLESDNYSIRSSEVQCHASILLTRTSSLPSDTVYLDTIYLCLSLVSSFPPFLLLLSLLISSFVLSVSKYPCTTNEWMSSMLQKTCQDYDHIPDHCGVDCGKCYHTSCRLLTC